MLRTSTILLFLITGLTCRGGIDLTPSISHYTNAGMSIQQLIFTHDNNRIEYEPPANWRFRGDPKQLRLDPPQKEFADAVIEAGPLQRAQPLDEKMMKTLEEQFLANVPPLSQFVTLERAEQNPVLVDGNQSFEVIVSYQVIGEKFLRSTLFVNLANTQLIFRLTARKADFEALHREFRISISSWHWVEPERSGERMATSAAIAAIR